LTKADDSSSSATQRSPFKSSQRIINRESLARLFKKAAAAHALVWHHFYIHTCSRIPSTIAKVTVTAVVSVLNACLSAGFAAEQFQ